MLLLFTLATGLTACGAGATLLAIATGRRPCFDAPFIMPRHIVRSLAVSLVAGPYMLADREILAPRRNVKDAMRLCAVLAICVIWVLAAGVIVIELALLVA